MGQLTESQKGTLAACVMGLSYDQGKTVSFVCADDASGRAAKAIVSAVWSPTKVEAQGAPAGSWPHFSTWGRFYARFGSKTEAAECYTEALAAITALPEPGGNGETPLQDGGETPLQHSGGQGGGYHYTSHSGSQVSHHQTATKAKSPDYTTPVVLGAAAIIIVLLLDI